MFFCLSTPFVCYRNGCTHGIWWDIEIIVVPSVCRCSLVVAVGFGYNILFWLPIFMVAFVLVHSCLLHVCRCILISTITQCASNNNNNLKLKCLAKIYSTCARRATCFSSHVDPFRRAAWEWVLNKLDLHSCRSCSEWATNRSTVDYEQIRVFWSWQVHINIGQSVWQNLYWSGQPFFIFLLLFLFSSAISPVRISEFLSVVRCGAIRQHFLFILAVQRGGVRAISAFVSDCFSIVLWLTLNMQRQVNFFLARIDALPWHFTHIFVEVSLLFHSFLPVAPNNNRILIQN